MELLVALRPRWDGQALWVTEAPGGEDLEGAAEDAVKAPRVRAEEEELQYPKPSRKPRPRRRPQGKMNVLCAAKRWKRTMTVCGAESLQGPHPRVQ